MAPSIRNQSRRQARTGYVDHDITEGLPVRHWRRELVTVAPPPVQETKPAQNDKWAIELPYGMPKDSHLLPQHSQDLLRAARSGRIYKRPAPVEEDEDVVEPVIGDKPEKKEEEAKELGYSARTWKVTPRHQEGPDVEYLAKRRKGIVHSASKLKAAVPTVLKTTVKRTDAAGNAYVEHVVAPHGQLVEGEVIAQTTIPDPNAAAALEGLAPQPTPPKKKSSSKKKSKGSSKSRKRKAAAPTSAPQIDAGFVQATGGAAGIDGVKIESEGSAPQSTHEDTEMGDGSMAASDDEEDGEEGDDGEEEGSVDNQPSPSRSGRESSAKPSSFPALTHIPDLNAADTAMTGVETSLPAAFIERENNEAKYGSPLKNVALATSPLSSPPAASVEESFAPISASALPSESAPFTRSPPLADPNPNLPAELTSLDVTMQQEASETAPTQLPPPPPGPKTPELVAAVETRKEEEEEEKMILDIKKETEQLLKNADTSAHEEVNSTNQISSSEEAIITTSETVPLEAVESSKIIPEIIAEPEGEKTEVAVVAESLQISAVPEVEKIEAAAVAQDDDDFPDLLGGLEKSLEKPEPQVEKAVSPAKAIEAVAPLSEESEKKEVTKVEGIEEVGEANKEEERGEVSDGAERTEESNESVAPEKTEELKEQEKATEIETEAIVKEAEVKEGE